MQSEVFNLAEDCRVLEGQMRDVGVFLVRSARPIATCASAFAIAALAYVVVTPSTYTANAQLMVESRTAPNLFDSNGRVENQTDSARVDSQVEIIKSDRIATSVINALKLMDNPEFAPPSSSLRILWPSWLRDTTVDQTESQMRYAAAIFGNHLGARRVGKSLVIDVSFTSRDPVLAAQIANAIVSAYLSEEVVAKSQSAGRGSKWLAERISELRRQAYEAQLAAGRFKLLGNTESAEESQVKLLELESTAQGYRRIYEEFLQKFAETVQLISYPEANARIVTSATKPLEPSHPRGKLIVLFAMMLGGSVGAGWSLARQSMDRTARSPDQIIQETGFNCLGTIAHHSQKSKSYGSLMNVVADGAPAATVARDLRSIRASIHSATLGGRPQSIGVVSCGGGDGASTIATNLAFLYTISGRRTLLVDCCPQNPTISRQFAPAAEIGLVQALEDASVLQGVLASREPQKCAFLPIGKLAPLVTPADRIASEKAAFRFDDLKSDFDLIIVDLPSLHGSSDAREIAPHLDGVILVASYGCTSVDLIRQYGAAIKASRDNVLGVILNKVGPKSGVTN
jgi:polysaccharide biosynthesis transport protein